ncbi:MAG: 50S ribosomal protein L3 [Patescibacteria group bacterium]|nr:50S ribosomal protein L3 [Patescibacteria group bacterium]MDE1945666.1 50S ribosomal protein L3 [Patescibacteria group bacterium]
MKFTLGTKQHMTQVFSEDGAVHPATVLSAGPMTVTQVKTKATDGYDAVQVAFGSRKEKNISKAVRGHLKGVNARFIKEFRTADPSAYKVGDRIDLSAFAAGDLVEVSAVSKGKGYQSVIKRHGFSGQPRSHGQKHSENAPGSISGGLRNKVPKGMRMAGRMGGERITVKNLTVVGVNPETNELLISGAVPGRRGTLVEVRG